MSTYIEKVAVIHDQLWTMEDSHAVIQIACSMIWRALQETGRPDNVIAYTKVDKRRKGADQHVAVWRYK